jgi:hypothetical protein
MESEAISAQTRFPSLGEEFADGDKAGADIRYVIDIVQLPHGLSAINVGSELQVSGPKCLNLVTRGCPDDSRYLERYVVVQCVDVVNVVAGSATIDEILLRSFFD